MYKRTKQAISLVAAIWLLGLVVGIAIDPAFLARAGSLIVVIGIILGFRDISGRLSHVDLEVKMIVQEKRPDILRKARLNGLSGDQAEEAVRMAMEEAADEVTEKISSYRNFILTAEAAILIVGTLTWGFGDLVGAFGQELFRDRRFSLPRRLSISCTSSNR